jgi:hypothetical protein
VTTTAAGHEEPDTPAAETDVLIVGAGPVGEDAIPTLRSDLTLLGGRIVHVADSFAGLETEVNARD